MLLQAALNGPLTKTEHPAVPVSVEELARDAAACVAAGAYRGPQGVRGARRRNDWCLPFEEVGEALRGAVVGLGECGSRDREREPRDAAARVGLGGVLPGGVAASCERVREDRVTTGRWYPPPPRS